jgi:hypothetical protein
MGSPMRLSAASIAFAFASVRSELALFTAFLLWGIFFQ